MLCGQVHQAAHGHGMGAPGATPLPRNRDSTAQHSCSPGAVHGAPLLAGVGARAFFSSCFAQTSGRYSLPV